MKHKLKLTLIGFFVIISTIKFYSQTVPAWLYFGQTPAGDTAVVFAPGVISRTDRYETQIAFSPDGNEVYFEASTDNDGGVYYTKRENNIWTEQVKAPFSGNHCGEPVFSVDGKKLYFSKFNSDYSNSDIWMVERATGGWSDPQLLSAPINSDSLDMHYAETADSVEYVESKRSGNWDIWRIDKSFHTANLDSFFADGSDPCIAPDGSYMIISSSRTGSYGICDLYVSFNKGNNAWTKPINMERNGSGINLPQCNQMKASLSPDGKFIFFNRHPGSAPMWCDIYWVSTHILTGLKKAAYAPVLSRQIPNMNVKTDSVINYVIPANTFSCEYETDSLKFTATLNNGSALPSWLSFNSVLRTLSGTPKQSGIDSIKVTVTNPDSISVSCIFKITITNPTGIAKNNDRIPKESKLFQNYPNPFNPTTVINYSINRPTKVQLSIYNLLGQKIKTLVNLFQSPGEYSFIWDATDNNNNDVSSGIYFYSLTTNGMILQKKMVLVR